jgi:hypothetical protein
MRSLRSLQTTDNRRQTTDDRLPRERLWTFRKLRSVSERSERVCGLLSVSEGEAERVWSERSERLR